MKIVSFSLAYPIWRTHRSRKGFFSLCLGQVFLFHAFR